MTGSIIVPRSGKRASATSSVIAQAAVAVRHDTVDIDNPNGGAEFRIQLERQIDRLLTIISLVAIASLLIAAVAG